MLKENLVEEAYIVGSVAKGTARVDSDIDIYLINSEFEQHDTELHPGVRHFNIKNIIDYLHNLGVRFEKLTIPEKDTHQFYFQLYKDEIFHFMYDYESESIKKVGEYIEINKELCDEINDL